MAYSLDSVRELEIAKEDHLLLVGRELELVSRGRISGPSIKVIVESVVRKKEENYEDIFDPDDLNDYYHLEDDPSGVYFEVIAVRFTPKRKTKVSYHATIPFRDAHDGYPFTYQWRKI